MSQIPQEKTFDSSFALLRDGYNFIPGRCRKLNTTIFQTRLMGEKVICITGKDAARLFYDNDRFRRRGAAPTRVQKSLFGEKGVQTLDEEAHRRRKEMFMSLMTAEKIQSLKNLMEDQWRRYAHKWAMVDRVNLFHETQELLCKAACEWAGVPLEEQEAREKADDFAAMIDAFGAVGNRHWRGRQARGRMEAWMGDIIADIREKRIIPPDDSAAYRIAMHKDHHGALLDDRIAAVELINVVRPIVAISWYIIFSALALQAYPDYRQMIKTGGEEELMMFAHEIRRFYPFAPFVGARVRKTFNWQGYLFPEGVLTLLDIYGMNHDASLWDHPEEFRPERFRDRKENPFDFIPQGGGDYYKNNRCAGEEITIEAVKTAACFLACTLQYEVPEQDLSYSLSRMPTYPRSGFIISKVKEAAYHYQEH